MRRVAARSPGRSSFRVAAPACDGFVGEGPFAIEGRRSPLSRRSASPPPRPSTLHVEVTEEQQRAIERLADYPRRVERLRLLWADQFLEPGLSRSAALRYGGGGGGGGGGGAALGTDALREAVRAGGPLTQRQIRDLMSRELTPEDYELLLLLDEGLKKAKTLSPEVAAALPRATGTAWVDEACSICLCALEEDEDVRMLPACGHCFHAPCAQRWLVEKAACPLCGREEVHQEKVMNAFRQFDSNGDGMFQVEEMKNVLSSLGKDQWSIHEVDRMFECIDVNKDGKIVVEEFVNWVFAVDDEGKQRRLRDTMNI